MNGGGATQEIARESDDRGLIWRVSTARVKADCLYSLFPKLMRVSAVVEGMGVRLTDTTSSAECVVGPTDIASLSGDILYRGELVDGGIRHLNLIYDPECAVADMAFLEGGTTTLSDHGTHVIYCCSGEVWADGTSARGGEVLMTRGRADLRLEDGTRALHISINRIIPDPPHFEEGRTLQR